MVAEIEAELWTPPFPLALNYLWRIYFRLRSRKPAGFSGVMQVEWTDIDAFTRMAGFRLRPWEVAIIERIDDAFCRGMNQRRESPAAEQQAIKDGLKEVARPKRRKGRA